MEPAASNDILPIQAFEVTLRVAVDKYFAIAMRGAQMPTVYRNRQRILTSRKRYNSFEHNLRKLRMV